MASSIVKSVVQQLGNLSVEEAKYLYKVRGRIESLQTELEWMECFLRDADTRQHQERVIFKWVSQVTDLAYDAEEIIQRYLHEVSHHRKDGFWNTLQWFSCIIGKCDAWTLHCLGSDIDDLIIKISELTSRLQRYGIPIINPNSSLDYTAMVREERRTYSHIVEDVVGLTTDINEVRDVLLQACPNFIGISGVGGLGKTTLARQVFQHKDVRDHFKNNSVWVYISKEFEKNKIFREILHGLDKGDGAKERIENLNPDELPQKIKELLKEKKCFIVLDDIWKVKDWGNIKLAFESIGGSASKILLTTRNQSVLDHVDPPPYKHPLKLLSPVDSWELLKSKASIKHGNTDDELNPGQMETLGKKMLKHCKGLPLAIVVLGGILSTRKTTSEWEDVHKYISSYFKSDMEKRGKNGLAVLELSYHDLPFNLKPCFLYLGNFPEDYEISTSSLYHLWHAEGLLVIEGEAKKRRGSVYDIGEMYLNELVQRSMVQVGQQRASGRIKSCRVHDVVRDMCLRKCEEVGFLNTIECTKKNMQSMMAASAIENYKLRRCALHVKDDTGVDNQSGQHGEKFECIRSLLVFPVEVSSKSTVIEVSRKMWKSFALIRVLYLENSNIDSVDGVEHLIHLKYLCLGRTRVQKLPPRFYDLKYVETLDLRSRAKMALLNKFHKMKRLIHLYLPREYVVSGRERLSFLASQMETLKNFDPEKCETKDLIRMTNMRVFSITFDALIIEKDELKELLESPVMINPGQLINSFHLHANAAAISDETALRLARHPTFNKLRLRDHKKGPTYGDIIDKVIDKVLVDSLMHLVLYNCNIEGAGIVCLGKLPNLQTLCMNKVLLVSSAAEQQDDLSAAAGNKMTFSAGSFQQLKEFSFFDLHDLEEWEVEDKALPNLRTLYIYRCAKLSKLPDGLPRAVHIECKEPCITGIAEYNTCPYYGGDLASEQLINEI